MKAFPESFQVDGGDGKPVQVFQYGMDLRDYFAASVIQGMVANGISNYTLNGQKLDNDMLDAAKAAYVIADGMMKVREQ